MAFVKKTWQDEPDLIGVLRGETVPSSNTPLDAAGLSELEDRIEAALNAAQVPIGGIIPVALATAPTGYLLCTGQPVTSAHSALRDLLLADASPFGNNGTDPLTPDLRGRAPVGRDGGAGRITANNDLGDAAGAQTHSLTTAQLASHGHGAGSFLAQGAASSTDTTAVGGSAGRLVNLVTRPASVEQDFPIVGTSGLSGSGQAHNNLQPYQIVNYAVRAE